MASEVIGDGSNTHEISVRSPSSYQSFIFERVEEGQSRSPNRCQFAKQIVDCALIRIRVKRVPILIKARQLYAVVSGEPQCPVCVDPFIIREVQDDFFDGPLIRCVTVKEFLLAQQGQKPAGYFQVLSQMLEYEAIIG